MHSTIGSLYEAVGSDKKAGKAETIRLKDTEARPAAPQGQEIDDAWEAVEWLVYLPYDDQRLVWVWANGAPWWKVAGKMRC